MVLINVVKITVIILDYGLLRLIQKLLYYCIQKRIFDLNIMDLVISVVVFNSQNKNF